MTSRHRNLALAFATALAGLLVAACARPPPRPYAPSTSPALAGAPRPAGCREVEVGSLETALEAASAGDALCLRPGRHPGPIRVPAGVTLWGPRDAVIASKGVGTTVTVDGDGGRLLGLTVDGSGGRFDTLDAAVHASGTGVSIEGVKVMNANFGILVEKAKKASVRANHVVGDATSALGLRGDGIRLWETDDSAVEDNLVQDSRDMVVWYSRRNTIRRNDVIRGRYGTHFMYSHDNDVRHNRYVGNEVGVFVMYSRGIQLVENLMAEGTGAAGMGIGVKESGNLTVVDNLLLNDTIGVYLDTSPLQQDEHNVFRSNVVRMCEQGVVFHSSERRNAFEGNTFQDNRQQVVVEGGGHALDVEWRGNHFDDYAGYDLDRDGKGDVPYEIRDLSSDLVSQNPELAFFRGAPALALVRAAGEIIPLLSPRAIMRDGEPSMQPEEIRPEALGAD